MNNMLDRIIRARTQLVIKRPFYGSLSIRLKLFQTDQFGTFATDGTYLYYPSTFEGSDDELRQLLRMKRSIAHFYMYSESAIDSEYVGISPVIM